MGFLDAPGTHVKICGITGPDDAAMCADAGADALGFNFFPGSSRHIDPARSTPWIRALPNAPARVAVVVNPTASLLEELRRAECFEWIQFHGDESPEFCAAAGFPRWIRAVRVSAAGVPAGTLAFHAPAILLDAWSPHAYGGTGNRPDPEIARKFVASNPSEKILLAGGLRPNNVREAVATVRPLAVDVAGGVESSPGKKDPALVREFVRLAKSAPHAEI
jgi:phosphoribosylanthranilate isomerase